MFYLNNNILFYVRITVAGYNSIHILYWNVFKSIFTVGQWKFNHGYGIKTLNRLKRCTTADSMHESSVKIFSQLLYFDIRF